MLFGISFAIHPKLETKMKMKIRMKTNFRMTKKFSYGWRLPFFLWNKWRFHRIMGVYICRLQTRRISRCVIMCGVFTVFEKMKFSFSFRIYSSNLIQSFINLTHQRKQNVIRFQVRLLILGFEECRLNALSFVIQLFKCKQATNDAV